MKWGAAAATDPTVYLPSIYDIYGVYFIKYNILRLVCVLLIQSFFLMHEAKEHLFISIIKVKMVKVTCNNPFFSVKNVVKSISD